MLNNSCGNECYLHENEKSSPYQRLSTQPRFGAEARGNSEMAYKGPIMNNTSNECVIGHETFIIKYVHVQLHYTTNSTCTELRKNVFIDPELKDVLSIASFSLFFPSSPLFFLSYLEDANHFA